MNGSGNPLQSWSAPDARQHHHHHAQRKTSGSNGPSDTGFPHMNGDATHADKPLNGTAEKQRPTTPNAANSANNSSSIGSGAPKPSSSSGNSQSSFWSIRPLQGPSLFPRRGFSAALHGHDLYWFGGKSDDRLHNDLAIMDSTSLTVSPVNVQGSIPAPREGHSASFIGRTMFIFGGELADGRCDDNLYAYNMANYTWYKVPIQGNPLVGRKGHTTVSVGSKLYVFGGTVDGYYLQDLVSFDVRVAATQGARWSYIDYGTNVPPGRAGHSSSVYLNSIYVFGGMNREECFNDLWAYNLEDQGWTKVTPHGATPPARYGHASAVVDDCIFIMGGRTLRGEPLNDFFAYKISLQRWYTFQVNSSAWPHQIDPIFSVVKSRLLLYSGNLPRDVVEPPIYSLDTSKIKIQPDATRPATSGGGSSNPAPAANGSSSAMADEQRAAAEKNRRHRSLMPPPSRLPVPGGSAQMPDATSPGARAASMVGGPATDRAIKDQRSVQGSEDALAFGQHTIAHDSSAPQDKPQPPANGLSESEQQQQQQPQNRTIPINGLQNKGAASAESLSASNASQTTDDSETAPTGSDARKLSSNNSLKGKSHQRKSIMISQGLVNNGMGSPPAGASYVNGPTSPNASNSAIVSGTTSPPLENGSVSTLRDDKRLTIQLRNRNSVAIHGQVGAGAFAQREPSSGTTDSPIVPRVDSPAANEVPSAPESATVPQFISSPLSNGYNAYEAPGPSPLSNSAPNSAPPNPPTERRQLAQLSELSDLPEPDLSSIIREGAEVRNSGQLSISSEAKDALTRAWSTLESKYAQQRQLDSDEGDGKPIDPSVSMQSINGLETLLSQDATRVLNVLLSMRRELADAKQQLAKVSQVAIERVTEAERGRKAALQEAIYLKAKASALTTANPALLGKLNLHRIHELERLYANTLNDNDALRNQLAGANLSLKQSHDALAEVKSDAELTRKQLKELESLYSQTQKDEADRQLSDASLANQKAGKIDPAAAATIADLEQRLADAETKLAEKESEVEALNSSERARAERMESALRSSKAATERAERVQAMFEESMTRIDALTTDVSELGADLEKQKAQAQRFEERAGKFEQLWTDAKEEISAFSGLRSALENIESKEQQIADLERKLSDAQSRVRDLDRRDSAAGSGPQGIQPRSSFASDASSATAEHRIKEFQSAYLAAHRQWSEARDELMSLRSVLRDTDERRRDMESKLASRERELDDMQARLSAFTELLQEYASKQQNMRLDSRHVRSPDNAAFPKDAFDKPTLPGTGAPANPAFYMSDDEISVSNMLAAIQHLQRSSSITSRPSTEDTKLRQQQQSEQHQPPTYVL
ncbi:hypothetical protein GGI12_001089 [Dipsacomyces acuminosporus]|nr:hypothetical protein GGI12_001089 [Dipsacomyces acuminosporus]